ncbi:MAG: hypothetical protein HRT89_12625 [Lentisphaeria bacterium]|nr:hypothetical protein [Lentisphaeria bacterium]NQZ68902.1 hypothetical protein [Lentisphaeria bacterium]
MAAMDISDSKKEETKKKEKVDSVVNEQNDPGSHLSIFYVILSMALSIGAIVGIQNLKDKYQNYTEDNKEDKNEQFKENIALIKDISKHGNFNMALGRLLHFDPSTLDANQAYEWYFTMGDLYGWYAKNHETQHWTRAVKFYKLASLRAPKSEQLYECKIQIARQYMFGKEYAMAASTIDEIDKSILDSNEIWKLNLMKARAEWENNNEEHAFEVLNNLLSSVNDEKDDNYIWSQVMVQSAKWMIIASKSETILTRLNKKEKGWTAELLRQRAKARYMAVVNETSELNEFNCKAKIGLVEIYLGDKNFTEAYSIINKIQNGICKDDLKVKTLMLTAEAEELEGNTMKSITTLFYGYKKYYRMSIDTGIEKKLYNDLVKMKEYDYAYKFMVMVLKENFTKEYVIYLCVIYHPSRMCLLIHLTGQGKKGLRQARINILRNCFRSK